MSHSQAISALLGYETDEDYMKYEPILNLIDLNNGSYTDGRLNYDTVNLTNIYVDYHNSYLEVPLRITGAAVLTADAYVAMKNGVHNLISAIQLKINNQDIINNDYLPPYNSFRLHLSGDKEWAESHGDLYHFSKDTKNTAVANQFNNPAALTAWTNEIMKAGNAGYNAGFAHRVEILKLERDAVATLINFTARIPLKMVHPFFESLDCPLINCRMQLTANVSGINNSLFFPFMKQVSGSLPATTNVDVGNVLSLSITGATKWVVYKCEFQPETSKAISANVASGLSKTVTYWSSKHFKSTAGTADGSSQDYTITPGIKKARRVVALFQKQADWVDQAKCEPALTNTVDKLTESNLEINNERVYPQNIDSDYLHFKNLQRELFSGEDQNSNGALITYQDFLRGTHRYYVYNISSSPYMIKDPNASVQLRFIGKKAGADNCELHFYVEHECNCIINLSTGDAQKIGD